MQYLKALALSALAIFAPIKAVLITAMVLSLADLASGVVAAVKRKEPITSKGLQRSVVKILVYEIAVVLAFLVQKYLIQDSIPVVSLIGGLIGITELKSVLENLDSISGDSFFKSIIDRLGSQSDKTGGGPQP